MSAVALGEPLAVDVLEQLVPAEVVVHLEDQGLLRADDGGDRLLLRLGHPMLGAAVRRRLSPARRRRIAAALLDARLPGLAARLRSSRRRCGSSTHAARSTHACCSTPATLSCTPTPRWR